MVKMRKSQKETMKEIVEMIYEAEKVGMSHATTQDKNFANRVKRLGCYSVSKHGNEYWIFEK